MLAADTDMKIRIAGTAKFNSHVHQFPYTVLIEFSKRIVFKDFCIIVCSQEFPCVIAAESKGHLGQIVCTEAEEICFFCDFIRRKGSTGNLDHRTHFVLKLNPGSSDLCIRCLHNCILDKFQFLHFADQRNHDFRFHIPVRMCFLGVDRCANYRFGLHPCDFRICNSQAASAVSHHRIEFMQGRNQVLNCFDTLFLRFCECGNIFFGSRNEFMKRGIKEPDTNRISFKSFIQFFKIALLIRQNLVQRVFTLFSSIGTDHLTESSNTFGFKEHMLRSAQADSFSSEFTRFARISGSIGIGADLQPAVFIRPGHNPAEFSGNCCVHGGNQAVVNISCCSVNGNAVPFLVSFSCQGKLLVFFIHNDVTASGNAAFTHSARYDRCMTCHAAAHRKNSLCALHTGNIFRRSFKAYQNNFFTAVRPCFCVFCSKYHFTASSAWRSAESLSDRFGFFQRCSIELRMQQSIQIPRVNHGNCFLFGAHSFINQITCNPESSLRSTLAVTALQHIQFPVFNCKLHILHIAVMFFQQVADLYELIVRFRELFGHLCDRHRSAHTGHNVFSLRIDKEFTHQFVFPGSRITCEGNAGTGIVVQVAEYHRHHVNSGSPAVRNVIVAAVYICAGIVPGAENSFDGSHQLFLGIRGEIITDLGLVFCFELGSQFFQVFGSQVHVIRDAFLLFHFVDQLLEVLFAHFHDNI